MNNPNQEHNIQLSIEQAKTMVERADAVQRLRSNQDFQHVVLKGYLEGEAVRLVHLKSDPTMADEHSQTVIDRDINAIGAFASYLQTILAHGEMSRNAMDDSHDELELARQENSDNQNDGEAAH